MSKPAADLLPPFEVIAWGPSGGVRFLDQTALPREEVHRTVTTVDEMIEAIQLLRVRGAPLIGIAAAMGLAAAASEQASAGTLTRSWLDKAAERLASARPTAVNLRWAVQRMRRRANELLDGECPSEQVSAGLREEAQRIWDEDASMCAAIGVAGAPLLSPDSTVLTHCNAGALATGGKGTALAVFYEAQAQGKRPRVIATETRPLRQGARLTAWELGRGGIDVTVVVDSAVASLMASATIDAVVTGADRIAANGDVANKIGTYSLAILADAHGVPFYVAAPLTTYDLALQSGTDIPIEERSGSELDVGPGAKVRNPAFDVTPHRLVSALITDRGVLEPPFEESIASAANAAQVAP